MSEAQVREAETEAEAKDTSETPSEADTDDATEAKTAADHDTQADADKGAADASEAETGKDADEGDEADKADLPENWRELAANGDTEIEKMLKRYGSLASVARALDEAKKTIRSGKAAKTEKPDPSDEKAMAEWRKANNIPDDPTGYKLPEDVTKRMVDADKPMLSAFTEFAHAKDAPPEFVEMASEWYVDMSEKAAEAQTENDDKARGEAEDELRKEWSHADFKTNTQFAKRWASSIPGFGDAGLEVRGPDGRRLGDNPEFVKFAADMGRERWGDLAFASGDAEQKHTARKEEIKKIMKTDIDRYYSEGLDKEYNEILEKEQARKS